MSIAAPRICDGCMRNPAACVCALPWEPEEMGDAPPLVCGWCSLEIADGQGVLGRDERHLLHPDCEKEEPR